MANPAGALSAWPGRGACRHTWTDQATTPGRPLSGGSLCALPSVGSGLLHISSHAEPRNELPADRGCHRWWWSGGVGDELLPDRAGPPARRARAGANRRELAQQAVGLAAPGRPEPDVGLPGFPYTGDDPDGFMGKDEVVAHLEAYARSFAAPVREGVRVTAVEPDPNGAGFLVRTEDGTYARGPGRRRHRRAAAAVHSGSRGGPARPHRAGRPLRLPQPAALPPGAVLVVGSGQAGCQIAEELRRAGRRSTSRSAAVGGRRAAIAAGTSRSGCATVGWFDRTVDEPPARRPDRPAEPAIDRQRRRARSQRAHVGGGGGGAAGSPAGHPRRDNRPRPGPGREPGVGRRAGDGRLRAIDEHIREQGLDAPAADAPDDLRPAAELAQGAPAELDLDAGGGQHRDLGHRLPARPGLGAAAGPGCGGIPGPATRGDGGCRGSTSSVWTGCTRRSPGLFAGIGEDAAYLRRRSPNRASAA